MNISAFIADRIQYRLNALRISRKEFAEIMGAPPSSVTKWLSGDHNFTIQTLQQIQRALKINFFAYTEEHFGCYECLVDNGLTFKKYKNNGTDIRPKSNSVL